MAKDIQAFRSTPELSSRIKEEAKKRDWSVSHTILRALEAHFRLSNQA